MDPVTHGITGALLGRAYFSKHPKAETDRFVIQVVTLGAIFPDIDVFVEFFSRDPLSIARYHRGFTHSFVGLPLFAAALAWLTREWQRRLRGRPSPSWRLLFAAYAVGIASHIFLDGMTTFGTRIWNPLSNNRVAWDFLFIIDFSFTAIVLLPQIAAWIYRDSTFSHRRALWMWILTTLATFAVWKLVRVEDFSFGLWFVATASVLIAALFFLPARGGWGIRFGRRAWCRAGVYAMVVYMAVCALAHYEALRRVRRYATENHIVVVRIGSLPLPPSMLDWDGLIRAPDGVYQARFDLRDAYPPVFQFVADSAPNRYTAAASALPDVGVFLWFARFPSIHFREAGAYKIVDYGDLRFRRPNRREIPPFTFRIILDSDGKLVEEGWIGALTFPRRRVTTQTEPAGP